MKATADLKREPVRSTWLRSPLRYLEKEWFLGYALIAPAGILILGLVAYPFLVALGFAVSDKIVGKTGHFVGLANFVALLRWQVFLETVVNSFIFTFYALLLKVGLGMVLALLMQHIVKGKNFFRGAVLLPFIVPTALSTVAWWKMLDPQYNIFNWLGVALGLFAQGPNWLGDPFWAKVSVILVNAWRGTPFFAISILAGLVAIPQDLYDAAKVDGAGALSRFRHVTLPLIKPILSVVMLFSIIFTFADFDIVYVLTRGGPTNSTHLFATLAYQTGLASSKLGEGAAIALFLFPVLMLIVIIQLHFIRKEGNE
ncbi:MAG: sugar ABC transporter permease [Candidatus Tectomicrobia bacterium]|uniref:Sugar ABC transporter permease n=1 Tax=Tectimicrobiota bacterium TaxID=2528274 RepID=A0A938B477_UNCTE|nr:sugar ABC transporter permease [Candidatus Tectomicrobia bacterium]